MGTSTDIDVALAGDDLVLRLACAPTSPATPGAPASTALRTCACISVGASSIFEALLTVARDSAHANDFPLVAMLGLLGLPIFEACGSDIDDLGEALGQ
ncbi:hypothetical protein ACQP0C_23265 [Nocardia sp. CA-129566]|uniref:hypothetical protein n=1 Tax=Nocardia sp. CA-129566 TaxID=3239976 RepID=UPI003D988CB2